MRHIFGDVKPEDYYPGGSKSHLPRIVLDALSSDDRSMTKSIDASVINSDKKINNDLMILHVQLNEVAGIKLKLHAPPPQ